MAPGARAGAAKLLRSRDFWLVALAAAVIVVVTRPVFTLTPVFGVEASWRAALYMAVDQHLHFGSDVVFPYGPAGWLLVPTYWYENTGALAVAYSFLEAFAFAALILAVFRARFGWLWALALGFAVVSMTVDPVYEPRLPLIALIGAVVVVSRPTPDRALLLAVAGGVISGFATLGRVNSGVMAVLLVAAALLFIDDRRRNLPVFAVTALGTFAGGWIVLGQSLSDLPEYFWLMLQIGSGFADAMQTEITGRGWEYVAAALLTAACFGAIWLTAEDRRSRAGLCAVLVVTAYFAFKQGFVRHDAHSLFFFETLTVFAAVLPWQKTQWREALAGAVAALVLFAVAVDRPIDGVVGPVGRAKASAQALHTLLDGGLRTQHRRDGRRFILAQLGVPRDYVTDLRAHSAGAWPDEETIIWAAGGRYVPWSTFQPYQAYTPELDRRTADLLADARRAPARIVFRRAAHFDRRATAFEAPSALRALFCNYRRVSLSFQLQMWIHTENRCTTAARPVATVHAAWGQKVAIPAPSTPNSFVYAEIEGVQVRGLEKLRSLALKSYIRVAVLDGRRRKRIIPAVAAEGPVLSAGAGIELARPYQLSAGATEITLLKRGTTAPSGKPLTYRFFEQVVAKR